MKLRLTADVNPGQVSSQADLYSGDLEKGTGLENSSPLTDLKNALIGKRASTPSNYSPNTGTPLSSSSMGDEEEGFGGRMSRKGARNGRHKARDRSKQRDASSVERESDLMGIVPANNKPTFMAVPKPGANPNPSPILPSYVSGQTLDSYGYGQTCVVDSSSMGGKRGLWQGLSAFDEAALRAEQEERHQHQEHRNRDGDRTEDRDNTVVVASSTVVAPVSAISGTYQLLNSGQPEVGDMMLVGGGEAGSGASHDEERGSQSYSHSANGMMSEGDAAVEEAVFGDRETREERDRERMLLGSRGGAERAQLGSRSGGDRVGSLLATLSLDRERSVLNSRGGTGGVGGGTGGAGGGGVRWSMDAGDNEYERGGVGGGEVRTGAINGTISRMSFSLRFDADNSLPLYEDDDELPQRWPFAALSLPQFENNLMMSPRLNSGRLSEPSEMQLGEGDLGSLVGDGYGSMADGDGDDSVAEESVADGDYDEFI